jgi:hypothetical protein
MIEVANTENLTGVTISGDFYDLDQLVNALYEITISDMEEVDRKSERFINISYRVLGICYDIRHASQGDREIFTLRNGITDFHKETRGMIVPSHNVYYSCNILYPEMIINQIALNELIQHRIAQLVKPRYAHDAHLDKKIIWDQSIAVIRILQSAFQKAVSEILSKPSFTRWMNLVNDKHIGIYNITNPFVSSWNLKYIEMSKEERQKKLVTVTKHLVEFYKDTENQNYRTAIDDAIRDRGWYEPDIRFEGLEYPEEIEW